MHLRDMPTAMPRQVSFSESCRLFYERQSVFPFPARSPASNTNEVHMSLRTQELSSVCPRESTSRGTVASTCSFPHSGIMSCGGKKPTHVGLQFPNMTSLCVTLLPPPRPSQPAKRNHEGIDVLVAVAVDREDGTAPSFIAAGSIAQQAGSSPLTLPKVCQTDIHPIAQRRSPQARSTLERGPASPLAAIRTKRVIRRPLKVRQCSAC